MKFRNLKSFGLTYERQLTVRVSVGFMDRQYLPSESQWAELWESQLQSLSVPKDVGYRLALAAEKIAYNEKDIVFSGPIYESLIVDGNKIMLSFANTGGGLISIDGEELSQFAIAGIDKKFVWANAKIEENKVVVWSDKITQPIFIRYAWADNPEDANLYKKEGLPAPPFRTDK